MKDKLSPILQVNFILLCISAFFQSVSDDSIDLGSSTKHPSVLDSLGKVPVRPVKKASVSVPWWQNDDDSEEGTGESWCYLN